MTNKERTLTLLRTINRPGMDKLINYFETSTFFESNCNGHHFIGEGGTCEHSLEVYDYMVKHNDMNLPMDSIIITSLCHDLGKSTKTGLRFYGRHDQRSLKILNRCGVKLSDNEKTAILNHEPGHIYRLITAATCPLYALLIRADCDSTGRWKDAHPEEVAAKEARRHHHHSTHHRSWMR